MDDESANNSSSPDGEFARSIQLHGSDRPLLGQLRSVSGGWLVSAGAQLRPGEHRPGYHRPPGELLLFDADGAFVALMRELPGPELFFGEAGGFLQPLVARRSVWDVAVDRLLLSDADEFFVRSAAPPGAEERTINILPPAPTVEGSEHDAILDRLTLHSPSSGRSRIRAIYAITSLPDQMPRYGAIVATRSGSAWVASYPDPREGVRLWVLFDPVKGSISRSVELPRSAEVFWASEREMVAVTTDLAGAQQTVLIMIEGES